MAVAVLAGGCQRQGWAWPRGSRRINHWLNQSADFMALKIRRRKSSIHGNGVFAVAAIAKRDAAATAAVKAQVSRVGDCFANGGTWNTVEGRCD